MITFINYIFISSILEWNIVEISATIPFAVILFILGIKILHSNVKDYNTLRKIENTETSKIRSVAIGLTEIKGKIVAKEKLISPFKKINCVEYELRYSVETYIPTEKPEYYKTESYGGKVIKTNDFYIEDETGRILVKANNKKIIRKYDDELFSYEPHIYEMAIDSNGIDYEYYKIDPKLPEKYNRKIVAFRNAMKEKEIDEETKKELLTLEKISKNYKPFYNEIKYMERSVRVGEEIYVLGTVSIDENGEEIIEEGGDKIFEMNLNPELNTVKILKHKIKIFLIISLVVLIISAIMVMEKI